MYSLTTPQKNIWNLQKFYSESSISNVSGMLTFDNILNTDLLEKAVNAFVSEQSGIRLHFSEKGKDVYQYVTEYEYIHIPVKFFESFDEARNFFISDSQTPFCLTDSPMYRFYIFVTPEKSGVYPCFSHLISDAWTLSIFCRSVMENYSVLSTGQSIAENSISYLDYVQSEEKYMNSQKFVKDCDYWNSRFTSKPELTKIKPCCEESKTAQAKRLTNVLDKTTSDHLQKWCIENDCSLAVLFEAAMFIYLHRINEPRNEIIIGVPVLNRSTRHEKEIAGMFISTMPLGVSVSDNDTISSLCEKISYAHREMFRHQKFPYREILKMVREKYDFYGNLYDVMVSYQNAHIDSSANIKYSTEWLHNGYSEIPLSLHIDDRDDSCSLTVSMDYQVDIFSDEEAKLLVERLVYILHQITADISLTVGDISIIPQNEYDLMINKFNDTAVDYPRDKCVHELFSEQAARTPDKTALVFEDKQFTYRQLDEMSNSLAHYLREKGVKPNDIVPIVAKRSWHIIVAMLGILKAGGAYMPVDPSYPMKRIEYMFETANIKTAVIYGYDDSLNVDTIDLSLFDYDNNNSCIENVNIPEDSCYIIFTSGSTGKPKGVMISHYNLSNFINDNTNNMYQYNMVSNCTTVMAVTTFVFDISVFEIFLSLINGLKLVLSNDEESISAELLSNLITMHHVDVIHSTPTKFMMFLDNKNFQRSIKKLKILMIGAEIFTQEIYNVISKYTNAIIYNGYGPTETTIGCSFEKITKSSDITIGRPIANTQIYILDKNRKPLPIGVVGELCISGDGVGKGYLNRPELTEEKFIPDPFIEGKTMYCTGDLARWRADGEIEYLGRIDTQVKIRGLRIELGEIESVMCSFEGIHMAAVTDKRDADNRQYLVGYYTSDTEIDEKLLRQYLSEKLPKYMVPNFFVHLSDMPMTASGKTDRKSLPLPDFTSDPEEYIAPTTDTEKVLAEIWTDILHFDRIGRNSDFIECGGDSLAAITLLAEIEEKFAINAELKMIMEHTQLSDLAECIDNADRKAEHIPVLHKNEYRLTPQQKAVYLACQKDKTSLVYNMPMFIKLPDNADIEKLKSNILNCYKNHSVLRTSIIVRNDEIIGVIDDKAELIFEKFDTKEKFVRPFDLSRSPLIRVGFGQGGMAVDIHHIAGDGESLNLILDEIFNGVKTSETVSYADYAEYIYSRLESGDFSEHREYFKNALHTDIEPLELPETASSGSKETNYIFKLNKISADTVKDFAKANDLTETCAYLALYGILMSGFTNKQQVITSIILSNRIHAETRYTCGMFVNTIPLAIDASPESLLGDYAKQLNGKLLDIYKYQELPFLEICEAAGIKDKNIINSAFVYQPGEMKLNGFEPEYIDTYTHKMDLSFQVVPQTDGSCKLMLEYNNAKYDKHLMERLAVGYERLISQLKANKTLNELDVMSEEEYRQVVYEFNNTAVDYPRDKCVHELFSEQAARTPDKTALVFEDKQFTYRQLDEMSNSLAHYLREKGVKPNDIVPIVAKRSWHIIVAMLGILKAGGAYMPVDPSYPMKRIEYMFDEADSKLALTYGFEKPLNICTTSLDDFDFGDNISSIANVNSLDDICYVIFTSGSTGKPKGVLLKHYGLVNFTNNNNNVFHKAVFSNCCNVLAIGAFTFDISVGEIFQPLLNGKCIAIADDDTVNSSEKMAETMIKNKIDLFHATPTRLSYYLDNEKFKKAASSLKVILSAGEAFSTELFSKIRNCTNAKIYNGYGPTETTVGCSFVEVTKPNEITIGKPISNVRIYILGINGRPCPIGTAGELCIAGAGVGKGYLKRPELTAERFVADPFVQGERMYRSGDLARWRADGEIEYLGRIDTQVKIRGLRIELGEIESVMCGFDGIKMSAATDKRDGNGRQYLVGYYISDKYVDERLLREYLSSKLPKYMVPNYFMRLDEIPMTVSGKTDRTALPVPSLTANLSEYAAPRNDIEKTLCEIAAELLNYEKVSINDDFFELGGDSLKAIEYTAEASDKGIVFDLQAVFEHPTIAELSRFISSDTKKPPEYFKADFDKYSDILAANSSVQEFEPKYSSLGNILLTGVTGYLGAHILDSLMQHEAGKIYCLVRSNSPDDRRGRWPQMLNYYFGEKYNSEIGKRIIPIIGDIIDKNLSEILPDNIQTVIHAAATVKHFGEYDYFYSVNVKGTENVLAYAKKKKAGFIFISTVSVSGSNLIVKGRGTKMFRESDLFIGQNLSNVYIRSKFEAERLVLNAKLDGVDCKIFRVGNLTNRYSDGIFQQNYKENAFLRRMKAFIDLKSYPNEIEDINVEFSPVDYTAESIVKLAEFAGDKYTVFHVNNPKQITYSQLAKMLKNANYGVSLVNSVNFVHLLSSDKDTAYDSVKNDLNEIMAMSEYVKVQPDSSFTEMLLRKIGFEWCDITQEYIDMYTKYFAKLDYWNTNGGSL